MRSTSLFSLDALRLRLARFGTDTTASVVMIFALSLVPIVLVAGFAIDHSRHNNEQRRVQAALDFTTLAVARRTMTESLTEAELGPLAQSFFDAQYAGYTRAELGKVGARIVDDEIVLNVKGTMDTSFMALAGRTEVPIGATAAAVYKLDIPVEIALVLDTSGSMSGQKLTDLKSSAKSLVDVVLPSLVPAENKKVQMSVVPFARYVNVGTNNRYESWIDAPMDQSGTSQKCSTTNAAREAAGCEYETYSCKKWKGSVEKGNRTSYMGTCGKWSCPKGAKPEKTCKPKTWTNKWYGCVKSRPYPLNINDKKYTTDPVEGFYGNQCPSALQPLTSSHQKVDKAIDALKASNDTYIPTGLVWGYRTLTPFAPFDEGLPYQTIADENGRKVMILMSDGANTRSPNLSGSKKGMHEKTDQDLANTYTLEVCGEAKAAGIEIYTIAFELKDTKTKTMLESCATDLDKYYDAADATALENAFKDIGADLSESLALSS